MSGSSNVGLRTDHGVVEDPERLAEFEARIAAGELIEQDDWMPEAYRTGMLRMAEHHANSEIVGALPEGEWITRAPSLKRKLALTAKVQDEVGHGQMLYRVSEDLGKTRDQMLRDLATGRTKYHNVFNYPAPTWGDIAMIQWLIDGAAIMNQKTLADGSFGPYVRTMHRINMEEAFHFRSGEDMVLTLMSGTTGQKRMAQDAFDRWWAPALMFFGPEDKPDAENLPAMKWRMKTVKNAELRQRFVDRFAPAALDLGLVAHLGDERDAFDRARALAGIDRARLVRYVRPGSRDRDLYSDGRARAETASGGGGVEINLLRVDGLDAALLPGARFLYLWSVPSSGG